MALHSKCFTIITYYYYYYENRVVLPSSTPLIQYTLYLFYQLFLYADNIHSAFQKNAAMGLPRRHTRSRTHTLVLKTIITPIVLQRYDEDL